MNEFGRHPGAILPCKDDLFHLAPIPLVYHQVGSEDLSAFNQTLIDEARAKIPRPALEVPDERHARALGSVPEFSDLSWSEQQTTAIGVWHRVPTNSFLNLDRPAVTRLRRLIEERYLNALAIVEGAPVDGNAWISESWIQFYQNSDYKVLHNHERYGPPYPQRRWAGAYYIDDGSPRADMPYSGVFSFRVRDVNHFIRPRPGLLLIWPADVLHEVHPFYGARERVVVNFNINLAQKP